jgi:predicted Zn-dependent peptidase
MDIKHKIYKRGISGIPVMYVQVPSSYTAYVGFHSLSGSYAETDANNGTAHYLEHVFFKGTEKRTSEDISRDGTLIGAQQNAFTSLYDTAYYLSGFPMTNLDPAVELLTDMVFNPKLPMDEIEKERTVILEEKKSSEDDHGSHFISTLNKQFHTGAASRSVLGTKDTIKAITRDDLMDYYKAVYAQDNTVFLVIGSMEPDEVFSTCAKYFKKGKLSESSSAVLDTTIIENINKEHLFTRAGIQQSYVLEYFKAYGILNKEPLFDFYAHIMGGGMNSLLFKELRENRGLCYSISMGSMYTNKDNGTGAITAYIDPDTLGVYKDTVAALKSAVIAKGFNSLDFKATKSALLGAFCRGLESVPARSLALKHLYGKEINFEERYNDIQSATLEGLNSFASDFLTNQETGYLVMTPGE